MNIIRFDHYRTQQSERERYLLQKGRSLLVECERTLRITDQALG
jgi:hypothetical protein